MRKLAYDVAASLDGFIAGRDGDVGAFLPEGDHVDAYLGRLQDYDTVVMGRRTYEFGYRFGLRPGDRAYPHMAHHVFSRSIDLPPGAAVSIVRSDWLATIDRLKSADGANIYLCGGGAFAGYLLEHGRLDRLLVKLNPILLGEGIPLFGGRRHARLRLEQECRYASGVVLLEYSVG